MKRMYPERSYGKFVCCDGLNHEWLMPAIKTLIHSIKVCFFNKELTQDLKKLTLTPSFQSSCQEPVVTWLGHSTFLIQVGGKNILTDPIFGSLSFVFRRIVPSVVQVQDLPHIDYVLISHNHFDHMDRQALCSLKNRFPNMKVLVPMGDKEWFDKHQFLHASEHIWWDEIIDDQSSNIKFTFLPANHWSQRTLFDKNRSLWGSWMVQADDFKIYFAGDTSWGSHFEEIGNAFKDIDVALLPIAPGEPRSWMKSSHINAREAVEAFIKLKAKTLIPMHWGTFHLGFDDFYEPIMLLKQSWQEFHAELKDKNLSIMKFGEMLSNFKQRLVFAIAQGSKEISL
ncbi:MAG TPA: MBL fold metallo-hydrolase [Candidatus Saccharimonadales bacterium]|nr:MBL fold metallo-hydrolase [Candidatus Saccharimonadales bacterium]